MGQTRPNSNSKPKPTLPKGRPTTPIDMMDFVSNWFDCDEILVDEITESENIAKNEEDGRLLCDCEEIWVDESTKSERINRIESELCKNEIGNDAFYDELGDRVANCGNRVQEKLVDCLNVVKNVEENVKIKSSVSGNFWITVDDLKMGNFDRETQLHLFDQLTSKVAAVVPCGSNLGQFNEQLWFNSKENRSMARFIAYALCAADEALHDAKWLPTDQEQKTRTGVSIGGGIGSISDIVDAAQMICEKRLRRLSPFFIPRILINMASGHVSMKYGFQGPNHAAVTACATGAHSIGDAARMIQFGDSDVMVAGGTESSIDALSIAGFCKSRALTSKYNSAPQEASRPFDCGRDGFVIGEGSGVLVLEELEHAKKRGAKIYAELRGYGMSGDAHHITQPHADGRGAILAMERALKQSGLHPDQVDYVNAHATSTPLGDTVEATAIKTVFSDHVTSGALAFSSTKGAVGHLLGAAGAVEAIFSILAINCGVAPLTLNLNKPDPIFNDTFMPLTASKEMPIAVALSNSFGFGGTNASLLFTKC